MYGRSPAYQKVEEKHKLVEVSDDVPCVDALSDSKMKIIASEPASAKRQREFFGDRIRKLKEGHRILQDVIRSATLQKTEDL